MHRSFLPEHSFSSFFFESAPQCDIVEIAKFFRINTPAGHDKVPMWSVKESINYIYEPLTYIINLSINSGVVPDQMKLAHIVPLFKSGNKRLFSNYRPFICSTIFFQIVWFQKISIPPPHGGFFSSLTPHPTGFSVPEGFALPPPTPWNFHDFFHLVPRTLWKFRIQKKT